MSPDLDELAPLALVTMDPGSEAGKAGWRYEIGKSGLSCVPETASISTFHGACMSDTKQFHRLNTAENDGTLTIPTFYRIVRIPHRKQREYPPHPRFT